MESQNLGKPPEEIEPKQIRLLLCSSYDLIIHSPVLTEHLLCVKHLLEGSWSKQKDIGLPSWKIHSSGRDRQK